MFESEEDTHEQTLGPDGRLVEVYTNLPSLVHQYDFPHAGFLDACFRVRAREYTLPE